MSAIATLPKKRPVWSFARRLGVQALMSVTVMAGLQIAAVNGYGVNDLLPGLAKPQAPVPEAVRVAGVPTRFDVPAEARTAPEPSGPQAPGHVTTKTAMLGPSLDDIPAKAAVSSPTPVMAALPSLDRVAVPSPRPRLAAARPVATPPPPSETAFDVSPRGVEIYDVAELTREEAPPMPVEADGGFHVADLVPSGEAILTRTAALTGSAADAVTGTAARLLDLAR